MTSQHFLMNCTHLDQEVLETSETNYQNLRCSQPALITIVTKINY